MLQQLQDEIQFTLSAEQTITNDTVRITAVIAAAILPDQTEAEVKDQVRATLNDFVKTAKWQLSGLNRSRDNSGVEKLGVTATTRVSETEYFNLDERAEKASRPGLKITHTKVDLSPPGWMIEKAQSELRQALLGKASKQRNEIGECLNTKYRIGKVDFFDNITPTKSISDASPFAVASYYSGNAATTAAPAGDDGVIGNTQKLTMHASVTLQRKVTEGDF